ncbi:MAG: S-methyl-5-thioribose-1-phosphate isomerase [Bacteroidota bacterium]|nr:S-methyl-5-thioribose-1-phosphate isomerase [Bacteroidota bacterium]
MNKNSKQNRAVWFENGIVFMVDQTKLPFSNKIVSFDSCSKTAKAIKDMVTRGAGSLGTAAGYAMAQAAVQAKGEYSEYIKQAKAEIEAARPTAKDLFTAVNRVYKAALQSPQCAVEEANNFADEIVNDAYKIGVEGNKLLKHNTSILTHCNAGRLAIVEHGSATAPMYEAKRAGKEITVYIDETRPRSQGALLTAYELNEAGINHWVIADNAAAWLMAQGKIDLVITGADRIVANGDTANKIGTLGKAIAAKEFGIPFYIAAPFSTFDFSLKSGNRIQIEERDSEEVIYREGPDDLGNMHKIQVVSPGSPVLNPAFDVTPAKYITGFITPKGIFSAQEFKTIQNYV